MGPHHKKRFRDALSKLLNNDQIHGYQYSQQLAMALKNVGVSCGRGSILAPSEH
jgi:hypothetical protein